jgi:hypothetical protein
MTAGSGSPPDRNQRQCNRVEGKWQVGEVPGSVLIWGITYIVTLNNKNAYGPAPPVRSKNIFISPTATAIPIVVFLAALVSVSAPSVLQLW